jgi:hypothetical protein
MPRALRTGMRTAALLLVSVLLAACGRGGAVVEGTLLNPDDAAYVWADGQAERGSVEAAAFRLDGVRGDTVDLRFATADDVVGWMRIIGLPGRARLTLEGIWFEEGRAFPSAIGLEDDRVLTVNGLRMAPAGRLPPTIETDATLLALSRDGEALLVRPAEDRLPDLRVVIGPGTAVRTEDGDPISLERLEFGDSLRVGGVSEAGFVLAAEITLPRRLASGAGSASTSRVSPSPSAGATTASPTPPVRSSAQTGDAAPPAPVQPARGGRSVEVGGGRGRGSDPPPAREERGPGPPGPGRGQGRGPDRY